MKKSALYGLLGSMLVVSGAAYAEDENSTPAQLATTNYVDTGLRAVYKKASTDLKNAVGDDTAGLTKDVADLKQQVATLEAEDNTMQAGVGITIDGNTISVTGLEYTTTDENMGKPYVYKSGELQKLETTTDWSN